MIRGQAARCAERLAQRALYARSVQLKLRSGGFSTLTRSTVSGLSREISSISMPPAADATTMTQIAWARYQTRIGLRLIGVGVSGLEAAPDPGQLLREAID